MNWFRLATQNLRFSPEIEQEIAEISEWVTEYYLGSNKNKQEILNIFKSYIQHEITHLLDPKLELEHFRIQPGSPMAENYTNPTEFDAYSKQAIEDLKTQIKNNPQTLNEVNRFLQQNSNDPIPLCLQRYKTVLKHWENNDQQNKTQYIRKFKMRIYSEITGNTI